MPETLTPRLLTVDEAAELLRCHRLTIYRRVQARHIRAVKIGPYANSPIRIAAEELERFLPTLEEAGADA